MRRIFLGFLLGIVLLTGQTQAQTSTMSGFRRNFAIVAFAGIGGAVLGLSTLSFYGTPQDHVDNITTGFLLGLAGGFVYVVADSSRPAAQINSDSFSMIDNPRKKYRVTWSLQLPIFLAEF